MEPTIECPDCGHKYQRRRLRCPNCNKVAIARLYKYLPYNENSLSILINKEIWCPKAKSLNDPFEFQFHLTKLSMNGIPIEQDSIREAQHQVRELGVVCLSEINDNILMWSHYAQGHTGFCIEFERTEENDLGNWDICLPVVYPSDNQIPAFSPNEFLDNKALAKIATTKASDWYYEKEWRLITKIENRLIPLPENITAIIFGCLMDNSKRRTIAKIMGPDIRYMEAVKHKNTFILEIKQVIFDLIMDAS